MQTHIRKWGNSLGLRIPIKMIKQLHLRLGSLVNIDIEDDKLIMEKPKYHLDELLEGITPANLHGLSLDDHQKGNEEW
jgi:antitoxin MazE